MLARVAGHLDPFAAIASFDFKTSGAPGRLGDRRQVWPPLVGEGMSRALGGGLAQAEALHSGQALAQPWLPPGYALAYTLHAMMLSGPGRALGAALTKAFPKLAVSLFQDTRG